MALQRSVSKRTWNCSKSFDGAGCTSVLAQCLKLKLNNEMNCKVNSIEIFTVQAQKNTKDILAERVTKLLMTNPRKHFL